MTPDTLRIYQHAAAHFATQNKATWAFAVYAANTGGTYRDLAEYIGGVSEDKVANAAHAWELYREMRRAYGGVVGSIRRLPYVYISHFVALHAIRQRHGCELDRLWGLLGDVVQGEGSISSRDLRLHAEERFGAEKAMQYEAGRAQKALARLLSRGDLEREDRELFQRAFDRASQLAAPVGNNTVSG